MRDADRDALGAKRQAEELLRTGVHPSEIVSGYKKASAAALEALGRAGAHAVLSGHVHDPFDLPVPAAGSTLRLIGAGTLSERVRETRPSFNELRIEGQALETRVHAMD